MIKVEFTYKTKTSDLDELMEKFMKSSDEKFHEDATKKVIEMFKREEGENTIVVLDIYYNSMEDYKKATKNEQSFDEWQEMWFSKEIKHEEVSVHIYDILRREV